MDTLENGESVQALPPVDVNENEEAGDKPYSPSNILDKPCPLVEDNNGCPADGEEGQTGKGHAFIASNGRNVNKDVSAELHVACTTKPQMNCTDPANSDSDITVFNGDIGRLSNDSETNVHVCYGSNMDVLSIQLLHQELVDEEAKTTLANGGLHIVNSNATPDTDTDCFAQNKTNVPFDVVVYDFNRQLDEEEDNIWSSSLSFDGSESNSGGLNHDCPAEASAAGVDISGSAVSDAVVEELEGIPLEPSAKLSMPSPCLSTRSNQTSDSQHTEPSSRDEEYSASSLPARPQSLRTIPNAVVSRSCDATPLSPEDGDLCFGAEGYAEMSRRQSAPDNLPDCSDCGSDPTEQRLMPKRYGIAEFFTRSLFSRKPKDTKVASHNAAGWRLFGKGPQRDDEATQEPVSTQQESQGKVSSPPSALQCPLSAGRRKNLEFEPLSTTALILEDRPANLPAKSEEEALRHRQEYDEMVAGAKRREMKEAQRKKRQMKERYKQEDSIANAMVIWNNDILPHWDTLRGTRRVRELWWLGLPPSVRGRVWSLAIGNELNITPELYEIFLSRAKEKWRSYSETSSVNESEVSDCGASLADRESSLDLIKLDISRTFPSLFIFQKGGPYHQLLHSVLGAYTCYRPDIGYVQGMSFIAAVLILNLEEADAFITFANLLNKPCQMAFFRVDHDLMLKYFAAFEVFFEENLPRLFNHFQNNSLTPDLYLIDWIFTLYSKSLPLDVACRVWDVFCRDGEESLFRTGLGILRLYEEVLLQMDFIHIAQFLTRLPEDLPAHTLFTAMAHTHMQSSHRRWTQVFAALTKDMSRETDKNHSPALRT
ncbi:TBC1 domain family member 12-like [Aplochiton taeniatus]